MVFSSMVFLCVFLPAVFLLYQLVPGMKAKNGLLIAASLLFYAYGEPVYILLMIGSTFMNYLFGLWMDIRRDTSRKNILILSVLANLSLLVFFKYMDMLIESWNMLTGMNISPMHISLPIGISFFTFQAMSYVIDIYRGEVCVQRSYWKVLLYISFFPQLIAGPIVKYHDIEEQIEARNADLGQIVSGMRRFIIGLGKKVLISNTAAVTADAVFATAVSELNIFSAWIGAIAYMLQIYYDFSGYSDMAIGLGKMFGFHFQENFQYPYSAVSIKEFWRRWHISLSTWFKEYIYIPLGGNRRGRARTCVNKLIVFFTTGLWHGANWTFVLWGLFHGGFLLFEEYVPVTKFPRILGHIYTLLIVCIGFVIFRADSVSQAIQIIIQMFTGIEGSSSRMILVWNQLTPLFIFTLIIAMIGMFPAADRIQEKAALRGMGDAINIFSYIGSVALLLCSMVSLAGGTYNPFIYFRF